MLTLAVPLVILSVAGLLAGATAMERRLRITSARMTLDPRWTPEEAEAIVAAELASLFARQDAVSRELRPRRGRRASRRAAA